ncbi:MAG: hypothetical protein AB1894_26550 [Chloroflexota bacterium]
MKTSKQDPRQPMPESSDKPAQAQSASQATADEVHFFDKQVDPYLDQPDSAQYTHLTAF